MAVEDADSSGHGTLADSRWYDITQMLGGFKLQHAWDRKVLTIQQKCTDVWGHNMPTIQQKCTLVGSTKYKPLSRNASYLGTRNAHHCAEMHHSPEHKMSTIQQKCRALEQRTPERRQSGDRSIGMQRITNTPQQKCMIGTAKMATIRQKYTLTQEPSL